MANINASRALPHHRLHGLSYEWQALIVVIVGSFMVMLDTTVVNIALPRIIHVFQARVDTAQFVLTGYMIALALIMPATGYLTDTFGTKRMYLLSMFLFTVGSLLCSWAWDVPSLVFFRVLQGLGGGMLMPLGMTIIFKTVPPEKRGLVTGVFGLPLLLAPVLGPTLGGYLVEYMDWRIIFTLNLPVGVLGVFLGATLLRETELIPNLHFDLRGFLLSGVGFASTLYGLAKAPDNGWSDPLILILVGGGSVLLLLWVIVELTESQPLVELRVFKDKTYTMATSVNFIITMGMFSSMLLLPLFLQNFRGLGAMETGILMLPQALSSAVVMPIAGKLFDRVGPRPLIVTGLLLLAYSTWMLGSLDLTTTDSTIRTVLILRGVSMGLVMMPAMTVAMNTLPGPLVARGSSLTNVLRQLFGAFGTAIFATMLQGRRTNYQALWSQTITPDSPGIQTTLFNVQQYVLQHGGSLMQAKIAGVAAIYKEVVMHAGVKSFDDCFIVAAVICVLGVVPALFLTSTGIARRPGGPPMSVE